eukprot:2278080-Rhodomonas_salina.1
MISHRSGETEDTFIADLVVGLGTGQVPSFLLRFAWTRSCSLCDDEALLHTSVIVDVALSLLHSEISRSLLLKVGNSRIKAGAPCRSERTAKYNQVRATAQREIKRKNRSLGTSCGDMRNASGDDTFGERLPMADGQVASVTVRLSL